MSPTLWTSPALRSESGSCDWWVAQAQPGDAGSGRGGDLVGEGVQVAGSADRVVVESLDAQQAPVGFEADLPQRGQIHQTFTDVEVAGVVDGGLGP